MHICTYMNMAPGVPVMRPGGCGSACFYSFGPALELVVAVALWWRCAHVHQA